MTGVTGANSREAPMAAICAGASLLELAREACPTLRRMGAEWRGPCPIYGGAGDNFAVNPARGL